MNPTTKKPTTKEDMSLRIKELKDLKDEIEISLGKELFEIVRSKKGFSFDFSVLVGGVVDVIEQAKSNSSMITQWKVIGDQVRNSENKILPSSNATAAKDIAAS
jgi:hypothetical protein